MNDGHILVIILGGILVAQTVAIGVYKWLRALADVRTMEAAAIDAHTQQLDGRTGFVHTTIPTAKNRNDEHYKTIKELATLTGVPEVELVELLEAGKIRGVKVVESWLARESDVEISKGKKT